MNEPFAQAWSALPDSNDARFFLIDDQDFLVLAAPPLAYFNLVTERGTDPFQKP
jgi:hypothetical protein